jgi:hypothetical protein
VNRADAAELVGDWTMPEEWWEVGTVGGSWFNFDDENFQKLKDGIGSFERGLTEVVDLYGMITAVRWESVEYYMFRTRLGVAKWIVGKEARLIEDEEKKPDWE